MTVLAVIVPVLVLAASAALLRWLLRRPSYRRILQYGWSDRRGVFKAVRSGRPLSRREVQVAEAQLDSVQRTGWVIWIQALTAVLLLVTGLSGRTTTGWLLAVVGGLNIALVPFQVWQRGRTVRLYRAALARPEPPTAAR